MKTRVHFTNDNGRLFLQLARADSFYLSLPFIKCYKLCNKNHSFE